MPTDTQELPINANAAKFIDWAIAQLEDPVAYQAAVTQAQQRVAEFYAANDREVIVARLKAKMVRGAQEHGEPYYPAEVLTEEISNEYIDLIGWMLIEEWNQKTAPQDPQLVTATEKE